uniref:Putative secreted protein n=1 Tax=Anopheles triannulatus TaxID=58253 RepID=A0A2M4B3X0_9DIPT
MSIKHRHWRCPPGRRNAALVAVAAAAEEEVAGVASEESPKHSLCSVGSWRRQWRGWRLQPTTAAKLFQQRRIQSRRRWSRLPGPRTRKQTRKRWWLPQSARKQRRWWWWWQRRWQLQPGRWWLQSQPRKPRAGWLDTTPTRLQPQRIFLKLKP